MGGMGEDRDAQDDPQQVFVQDQIGSDGKQDTRNNDDERLHYFLSSLILVIIVMVVPTTVMYTPRSKARAEAISVLPRSGRFT
ncbi:hypothetical protein D3C71_2081230 [compost metagenome]